MKFTVELAEDKFNLIPVDSTEWYRLSGANHYPPGELENFLSRIRETAPSQEQSAAKDDPYRILIVDDDISTKLKARDLFENTPARAEVVIAGSEAGAIREIEKAAKLGRRFDMVDVDYFLGMQGQGELRSGLPTLRNLMKHCETLPDSQRPKQFSLHSKDPIEHVVEKNMLPSLKIKS